MNLLLFEEPFESCCVPLASRAGRHLIEVLKVVPGATVYIGFIGGERALCSVQSLNADACCLRVERVEASPPLLPLTLCIALPRPHSARKVLYDAAMLGVRELVFFAAERSEPSYRKSRLWLSDEWRERINAGLEQSFSTLPPHVRHVESLPVALATQAMSQRAALDNYEACSGLAQWIGPSGKGAGDGWCLFIGPERGWSAAERDLFRANAVPMLHLGPRVLRVETAAVVATALVAGGVTTQETLC